MPYTTQKPPEKIKDLPKEAQALWINAFNSAYEEYNKDEEVSSRVAWSAVGKKYKKEKGMWSKMTASEEMSVKGQYTGRFVEIDVSKLEFAEDSLSTEIQVLPIGKWKHPVYGSMSIDENDLNEFSKNFDDEIRRDICITEGHPVNDEELPAVGWFKSLINKGRDGLWAIIEWTEDGKELLASKKYKYFSPEYYSLYEDPEDRKTRKNVLVGGALTNRPYFKGLQAIVLSEYTIDNMDLNEILKKDPAELSDEEVTFVKEKQADLTDEQKDTFKDVLEDGAGEEEKTEEKPEEKPEEKKEEKIEASEKMVVDKVAYELMEKQAMKGASAFEQLEKQNAELFTEKMTFSDSNKNGVLLPKSKEIVTKFYLGLSNDQRKNFKEIMEALPKSLLFSESGHSDEGAGSESEGADKVDVMARKRMSEVEGLSYVQATRQILNENPALEKEIVSGDE